MTRGSLADMNPLNEVDWTPAPPLTPPSLNGSSAPPVLPLTSRKLTRLRRLNESKIISTECGCMGRRHQHASDHGLGRIARRTLFAKLYGSGEWGMGNGEWGVGNGEWGRQT